AALRERSPRPAALPPLLGHAGAPPAPEVVSFEQEVDRLAAALAPLAPFTLLGYSLGARLALGLSLRHPALVRALVLLSGHPGLAHEDERSARIASDAIWQRLLEGEGLAAFVPAWQAQPLWASQSALSPELRRQKELERLSHDARGLARSLAVTGLGRMPCYRDRLAELRLPTAFVAGALDAKFSRLAREMAR